VFNRGPVKGIENHVGPSEEDLLLVLMHRCRERGLDSRKSNAKIQRLELQVFELHAENIRLARDRETLSLAQTKLQEEHQELRTCLDEFKTRFKKVKNLGDHISRRFEELHIDRKEIDDSIAEIRETGKQAQNSLHDAAASFQKHEAKLHEYKANVATVKLNIIRDLQRNKGRLEAHILNLEHARQKMDLANIESSKDLNSTLSKVSSRLDNIDTATIMRGCLADFVEKCSTLNTSLQKELEDQRNATGAHFGSLDKTITKEGDSLRCAIQHFSTVAAPGILRQIADDLKNQITKEVSSSIQSQSVVSHLTEQLKGSQSQVEQLRKALDQSESLGDALRKDIETSSAASGAQLDKYVEMERQRDIFRDNYTSMKAEVTIERQSAKQKAADADAETQRLRKLADQVECQKQAVEKRLIELQDQVKTLQKTKDQVLSEVRLPQIMNAVANIDTRGRLL
jgi:chromosome segregation ATPase